MNNHPGFLLSIVAIVVVWFALMAGFYRRQNQVRRLGGPISIPKTIWLGLTTFSYFVLPWLIFGFAAQPNLATLALLTGCLMLFRAVFQIAWMFLVKKWSPPMGIGFNLIYAIFILAYGIFVAEQSIVPAFLWAGLMLTDTLFAWQFYRLVGEQTKGNAAVWYADNSARFRRLNLQTIFADVIFLLFLVYFCLNYPQC